MARPGALGSHGSAMGLYKLLHDGQAEAEAPFVLGGEGHVEDPGEHPGVHAPAVIPDDDVDDPLPGKEIHDDERLHSLAAVGEGVGEEVREDLLEGTGIAEQGGKLRRRFQLCPLMGCRDTRKNLAGA